MAALRKFLVRLAEWMAWLSGGLFLLLAFYMTIDSISRTLGGPFTGISDQVASLTLMLGATWPLAYGINTGIHVRSDVLLPLLPKPMKRLFWIMAMIGMTIFGWLLAWQACVLTHESYEIGAMFPQSIIEMRLDIPQAVSAVGFIVFAVTCTVVTLNTIIGKGDTIDDEGVI